MKREYVSIDISKLILSLFVVAVHVNPFGERLGYIRFPLTRIAVPLFFIFSSFFLFKKLDATGEAKEEKRIMLDYCKRNLVLYFSWFIVLFPINAYVKGYFEGGIFLSLKMIVLDLVTGSVFTGSWFILATIIGSLIVFFLSKCVKNSVLIIFGIIANLICCSSSNYFALIEESFYGGVISNIPFKIYLSFFVSIVWIALGKAFAENEQLLKSVKMPLAVGLSFAALALLFAEHYVLSAFSSLTVNDCYVSLMLICPVLFVIILKADCRPNENVKKMRITSTVTYCMHAGMGRILSFGIKKVLPLESLIGSLTVYLLVVGLCTAASLIIAKLSKKQGLQWLKCFY